MADDGNGELKNSWALPKFHFQVQWDSRVMSFEEVSGLNTEPPPVEYRDSNGQEVSVVKMSGMHKMGNITMKRGVFEADNQFWDWFNQIKMNTINRVPVTIRLLDESGSSTMAWTLHNAWPVRITGTDLKADANEVAVDTIEIAHEGVTIADV